MENDEAEGRILVEGGGHVKRRGGTPSLVINLIQVI